LAKGTILAYNNITIGDGPLPAAIAERAADHFAARQAGLKCRERATITAAAAIGAPCPVPGAAPAAPLPEAAGTPKVDPNAPPPVATPSGGPLVIPPTVPAGPKDAPPTPQKDGKDPKSLPAPAPKPIEAPGPLPGLPAPEISTGPTLPVGGTDAGDGPAMPAT